MNVRELKQAVDAATVLARGTVHFLHLPTAIVQGVVESFSSVLRRCKAQRAAR